mmetsp:Transcript_51168/g.153734  ORF Transcript_51168/g.153734 Transcript_51168/m.153734 type:complete len:118 (+) Transcript_51168:1821-2174(+)
MVRDESSSEEGAPLRTTVVDGVRLDDRSAPADDDLPGGVVAPAPLFSFRIAGEAAAAATPTVGVEEITVVALGLPFVGAKVGGKIGFPLSSQSMRVGIVSSVKCPTLGSQAVGTDHP